METPGTEESMGGTKKGVVRALREALRRAGSRLSPVAERYYRSTAPYRLSSADRAVALGLTTFFFLLYLYTCSHSPNMAGDSPELVAGSYSLGVVHPPGYPLYTLIGFLFSRLPFGNIAFRVNLTSVIYHTLALLLFYVCTLKITGSRVTASIACAALGFSPLFWFYSLMAEVFPLNDLFIVVILYTAIRSRERWQEGDISGSFRRLLLLSFLLGLSLCNHQTIIFLFPAALLIALQPLLHNLRKVRFAALFTTAFLLGLLPYVYLPLSASRGPYVNFGDPSTLKDFLNVVTRRYYGTARLWKGVSAEHRLDLILDCLKSIGSQARAFGMALGGIGAFRMARRRMGDFLPLIVAFIGGFVVFPALANVKLLGSFHISTIERFYLLPGILFFFFIGEGIEAIRQGVRGFLSKTPFRADVLRVVNWTLALLLSLPFILPATKTVTEVSLRYDVIGEAYIDDLLASVEEGSLIFVEGDVPTQLMEYYETCLPSRKRIYVVIYPFIFNTWYAKTLHKWYPDLNFPELSELPIHRGMSMDEMRLIYVQYIVASNPQVTSFHTLTRPAYLDEHFEMVPWGMTFRLFPKGTEPELGGYLARQLEFWQRFRSRGMDLSYYSYNRREYDIIPFFSQFPGELADYLAERGLRQQALRFLLIAYSIAPDPDYLRRIAEIYREDGNLREFLNFYALTIGLEKYDNQVIAEELLTLERALEGYGEE